MPFPERVVKTRGDVEEVITTNTTQNILEKASVSNMVGLLSQMNELSNFAAEVFEGILGFTDKQMKRIASAKQRLRVIEGQVPTIERRFIDCSPSYFYDNPYNGKEFTRKDPIKGLLFSRHRSSLEVNRRRDEAEPIPDMSHMNRFSKGPCIKKYTDSDFFLNQWLAAEKQRMEEEKRIRKERKAQKREARKKRKKAEDGGGRKKIAKVKKKKFNAFGAEFGGNEAEQEEFVEVQDRLHIEHVKTDVVASDERALTDRTKDVAKAMQGSPIHRSQSPPAKGVSPSPQASPVAAPQKGGPPPVPIPAQAQPAAQALMQVPGQAQGQAGGPPPVPQVGGHQPQASYVPPQFGKVAFVKTETSAVLPDLPAGGGGPPPVPGAVDFEIPFSEMTPQMRVLASQRRAEQEARQREAMQAKIEEQKKKAAAVVPTRNMNFLQQIKSGTNLKRTEIKKRALPMDSRDQLLASLKGNMRQLKKVNREEIEKQKQQEDDTSNPIYQILQRRGKMLLDDDDSDGSDSSADWDP